MLLVAWEVHVWQRIEEKKKKCAKAQGTCQGRGKDRSGDSNSVMLIIWKKTLRQLKAEKAIACNFNLFNETNHELNAKNLRVKIKIIKTWHFYRWASHSCIVHPLSFNPLFLFFPSITMHEPVRHTWDVDCIT